MTAAEISKDRAGAYSNSLTDFQSAETLKGKEQKNLEQYLRTPEESSSTALQRYKLSSTLD